MTVPRPKLSSLLSLDTIRLKLNGHTKQEVIDELLDLLLAAGRIEDRSAVRTAVIQRERKLSTGLGHGIAIPHGKSHGAPELTGAFGIHKQGVLFDAADGKPVHIFFMLVSPQSVSGPHIKALAQLAKVLRLEKNRKRLLDAAGPDEILKLFDQDL